MFKRSFQIGGQTVRKFTTRTFTGNPKPLVRHATFGVAIGSGFYLIKPQTLNCDGETKANDKSTTIAVANACVIAGAKDLFRWYNGTITTVEYVKNITTAGVVTYTTIKAQKGVDKVIDIITPTNDEKKYTEHTKEKVEEPVKEMVEEPVKEKVEEPVKEKVEEPVKEKVEEPVKEKVEKKSRRNRRNTTQD